MCIIIIYYAGIIDRHGSIFKIIKKKVLYIRGGCLRFLARNLNR